MADLEHKRGDTMALQCAVQNDDGSPVNITGWTIRSQIKSCRGVSIDSLTATVTNAAAGQFTLTKSNTTGWRVGPAVMDIEYTDASSRIISSTTIELTIVEDVTV